jgi:hypothetical protein
MKKSNTYFHLDITKLKEFDKPTLDYLNKNILPIKTASDKQIYKEKFDNIILNNNHNNELIIKNIGVKEQSSNVFFIYGAKGAGKSTYLRGSKDNKTEGLLISLLKDVYKINLSSLKKGQRLIFKIGCFAIQEDQAFSLLKPTGKEYYDEFVIYNDNSFYIKHINNFTEFKNCVENSISQRGKFIDKTSDYLLLFHVTIDILNYTEHVRKLQFDFFEFNFDNPMNLNIYIENLLTKNFSNKKFYIERLLYKDISFFNSIYFVLVIDKLVYGDLFKYLKTNNYLKKILNRKNLLTDNENLTCEFCIRKRHELLNTLDINKQLINDLNILNDQLAMVFEKIKTNKTLRNGLASVAAATTKVSTAKHSKSQSMESIKSRASMKTRASSSYKSVASNVSTLKSSLNKTKSGIIKEVAEDTKKLDEIVDFYKTKQQSMEDVIVKQNCCTCS